MKRPKTMRTVLTLTSKPRTKNLKNSGKHKRRHHRANVAEKSRRAVARNSDEE